MGTTEFAEVFACRFRPFVAATVLANCAGTSTPANSPSGAARDEATSRLAYAAEALDTVDDLDEHRIPSQIAARAKCVAVVPGLVNGAFVVGAKHGRGVVTCRSDGGWSTPAFFTLSGGTAGFEVGVQSVDVVMIVLTEGGKRAFLVPELQLGGDASASAGPEGRGRSEDTDPSLRAAIVSYSSSRGLFAGVALSGATIHQDTEAARALYGHDGPSATLLRTPASRGTPADPFLARVRALFGQ
jgi:lipid-binding SYLF domain-containing protein